MSGTFSIYWPPKVLSPNSRGHWSKVATAKKRYRADTWAMAQNAKLSVSDGPVNVKLTFCPPTNHERDRDNLLASVKALLDGLADALGVNDSLFRPSVEIGAKIKGGAVVVEVNQ